MKKWPYILLAALEASVFLLAVYCEPGCRLRGHLWGEAFFDGKPTSYWRRELQQWEVTKLHGWRSDTDTRTVLNYRRWGFHRHSTRFEQFCRDWFPPKEPELVYGNRFGMFLAQRRGPRLLHGSEEAVPVLRELLDDRSPKIRRFAQIGLKMNPKLPGEEDK